MEQITIEEAKRVYQKAIAEGIVGGLNLTSYKMKEFEEILKEVKEETKKANEPKG